MAVSKRKWGAYQIGRSGKWMIGLREIYGMEGIARLIDENQESIARLTDENQEANAHLIVSTVNACKAINPDHPELVAGQIENAIKALEEIYKHLESGWIANECKSADKLRHKLELSVKSVLAKIEGRG